MGRERLPVKAMHGSIIGRRNPGRQTKKWIENKKLVIDTKKTYSLTKTSYSSLIIILMEEKERRDKCLRER